MIRTLYRGLLWLHPGEFAERFADEMLWIFDLRRQEEMGIALLSDCFLSLCRQWFAVPPVRTFAIGLLVNGMFSFCSAMYTLFFFRAR
jgi:hypothetical protein